jgi:hypothetical protein
MKTNPLFKNLREYENLHVALWLIKDACWVMTFRTAGMIMILPTLAVALHLAWKSRKNNTELFHNVAICYWIAANGMWMTGEFFYNDGLRPYAMVLFAAGLVVVASYYLHFRNRKSKSVNQEVSKGLYRTLIPQVKKVA